MRVMYVAPRYHTNQIPVIEGWIEEGSQVKFISQFAASGENYDAIKPEVLGYSRIFEGFMYIYKTLFCASEKSEKKEYDLRIKLGFPPIGKAGKIIREFKPDVVILRERSLYNIPFSQVCKRHKIKSVLYNQSPLYDKANKDKGLIKKILLKVFPKNRMTPVMGVNGEGKKQTPNSFFVPFIQKMVSGPKTNTGANVRLLCVARYEERKNLLMLVDAVEPLIKDGNMTLRIVGEVEDERQINYYALVENKIKEKHLEEKIELLTNKTRKEVFELYKDADVFVLPSTKERASIAQLEAMSCSLPIICSDSNGSACYVSDGENGYLFADNDVEDLREKIKLCTSDRKKIEAMSESSQRLVMKRYQFANYKEALMKAMAD